MMRRFGESAAQLSRIASLVLGWRPDQFWNSTPKELASVLEAPVGGEVPDPATIEALRRQFPDQ
jgi:uncharacterized phage protein (TIGR02216 family)